MSSTTVTTTTTTTTVMDRRTYWCHECDMSISLLPTSSLCPHCNSDDEELLGFGLRHLARRHRLVFPIRHQRERRVGEVEGEVEALFSPTQIGEEVQVDVMPDSGRTNSVETVSSWPSWPVDGGEIAARVNDDDDVVMS
ncbi:putative E3 ubiquitin-protein ligase RNF126-like, zinc-ribbon [Helianthus debilis subsp. tardiflorus]